jgi:hypothetical protein
MYNLMSLVFFPFSLLAALIFCYGIYRLARHDDRSRYIMASGLIVGLVGVLAASIVYLFSPPY